MVKVWNEAFPPVIDGNSKVLILGSFPSVKSREVGFYYGNPKNRFWGLLSEFFGEEIPADIDGKKYFLLKHRIALWDVIDKSTVKGSSDNDLKSDSIITVPLKPLVENSNIELILLNGKKAFSVFEKIYPDCLVKYLYLPSTSSANVSYDKTAWINALTDIFE